MTFELTTEKRYSEALIHLYAHNDFHAYDRLSIIHMPRQLAPEALSVIRTLKIEWCAVNPQPYIDNTTNGNARHSGHPYSNVITDPHTQRVMKAFNTAVSKHAFETQHANWRKLCKALAQLTGLRTLHVKLLLAVEDHWTWRAEEERVLGALKPLRKVEKLRVEVPWRSRYEERSGQPITGNKFLNGKVHRHITLLGSCPSSLLEPFVDEWG